MAPDPDGWVTNRYSLLGTNLVGYANDELEEQILRGRRGFTLEERAMVYQEMTENYLLKDLPIMGQWVNNRQYVKSERFIMPLWEGFREPTSLDGVPIVSTLHRQRLVGLSDREMGRRGRKDQVESVPLAHGPLARGDAAGAGRSPPG